MRTFLFSTATPARNRKTHGWFRNSWSITTHQTNVQNQIIVNMSERMAGDTVALVILMLCKTRLLLMSKGMCITVTGVRETNGSFLIVYRCCASFNVI